MVRVTAAVIRKNGKILLARRSSGQRMAGKWELAGGKIEEGETPEQGLAREMKEEFGISVRVGRFLGSVVHTYDRGDIELMAYEVEHIGGEITLSVHDQIRWVLPGEIDETVLADADVPLLRQISSGLC